MNSFFYDLQLVYNKLEDDISRYIFMKRLNYSATGDMKYIIDMDPKYRNLSADTENFFKDITDEKSEIVLFGAGEYGITIASELHDIPFKAFIDNFKSEKIESNTKLPIYSFNDFINKFGINNYKFLITVANPNSRNAIFDQLIENRVNKKDIIPFNGDWRNNTSQYFDVFSPMPNEVFVDCGCFDGSTAFRFAGWCENFGYDMIYSFEPDPCLFRRCKKNLEVLNKCEVYPYGVSDREGTVSFLANGNEDARIVNNIGVTSDEIVEIPTISLDNFLKGKRVTFIKMDIEGAEYNALLGAEQIIRNQKPKLAICIYHSWDHFVSIPKLLLNFRPDYKFKFRHYSLLANETILYAE